MKPGDVKRQLRDAGVRPSRRLGQHFLLQESLAQRIVGYADIRPGQTVLEVGPGLGTLTRAILEKTDNLVAVERDPGLSAFLRENLPGIHILEGDVLRVPLPPFDKVVSNLPYEISSPFTFRLLGLPFQRAVITYQLEFAERLVAPPGTRAYSRLTLKAHYRCDAQVMEKVSRGAFWPPPKVESAVVKLDPRPPPFEVDPEGYGLLVDAIFAHRRKRVLNALLLEAKRLGTSKERLRARLEGSDLTSRRPQDLRPGEVAHLTNLLFPPKG